MKAEVHVNLRIEDLIQYGLSSRAADRYKVEFIASFDLGLMSSKKTVKDMASFFDTQPAIILKVIDMQKGMGAKGAFPKLFLTEEDKMVVGGEFNRLKNTELYKRLKEKRLNKVK